MNRAEWFEDLEAIIRHHLAVLEIIVATVWEILIFKFVLSGQLTGDSQRLHPLRSDFFSAPICWNDCNVVVLHFLPSLQDMDFNPAKIDPAVCDLACLDQLSSGIPAIVKGKILDNSG
jgi:hypothetical protein